MQLLLVKFRSKLAESDVLRLLEERLPLFRAVPGLVQKYYAREAATGEWCGVYIFESEESLLQYRASELARSIPPTYQLDGPPRVEILEMLFPLRPEARPQSGFGGPD